MQMMRDKAVAAKLACSRVQVWNYARTDPDFPKPYKLAPRHTVWAEEEIDVWLKKQKEQQHENG